MTAAPRTPCSDPPCNTDGTGDPCDRHETEAAHAEGEHGYCGVTCEVQFPTEQLRNTILYRAIPGSKNMLAELERRAGADAVLPVVATERADAVRDGAELLEARADELARGLDDLAAFVAKARQIEARHWRDAATRLRARADAVRPQGDSPTATPKES